MAKKMPHFKTIIRYKGAWKSHFKFRR